MWTCPYLPDGERIIGEIGAPGSKSYTNRYLVLRYLSSDSDVKLVNQLESRDSELMINALSQLAEAKDGEKVTINTGLAGTVMRFLPGIAALRSGETVFDGDIEARKRPMKAIIDALERLGVLISRKNGDFMPFSVIGTGSVDGGYVEIDASASSQFISGLLLCGAKFNNGIEIKHIGKTLPSLPHIEMTIAALKDAKVTVESLDNHTWKIKKQNIQLPKTTFIEPDLSNLMVFAGSVLANKAGGEVMVKNWPSHSIQPGILFVDILQKMGAKVSKNTESDGSVTLKITADGSISGIEYDLSAAGEITPTTAALLALSPDGSHLTGIKHLRGHETDRLLAIVNEIVKIGRKAVIDDDSNGITIWPADFNKSPLKPANFESYADHRMATFAALVGLRVKGCMVNNIQTVAKTMPNFVADWQKLLRVDG